MTIILETYPSQDCEVPAVHIIIWCFIWRAGAFEATIQLAENHSPVSLVGKTDMLMAGCSLTHTHMHPHTDTPAC